MAHPDPVPAQPGSEHISAQRSAMHEFTLALHWSPGAHRGPGPGRPRAWLARHPRVVELMEAGELSWNHARALTDATRDLDPVIAAKVEARVLDRAPLQTPAEFRRSLRRAVAVLDPRGRGREA